MTGTLSLFGFPSTPARLDVRPRSTAWRAVRAGAFFAGGILLAPLAGLVPPHAPWALGILGIGGFLGLRKWRERFTILSFQGACPKCGKALDIPPGTPLRPVMTVSCPGCHHDSRLTASLSEQQTTDPGMP